VGSNLIKRTPAQEQQLPCSCVVSGIPIVQTLAPSSLLEVLCDAGQKQVDGSVKG
jgi:hypothetical protein